MIITVDDMKAVNFKAMRVNNLALLNDAKFYLEIGVQTGKTFFNVNIDKKFAVDPAFMFDIKQYAGHKNMHFFSTPSDEFFEVLEKTNKTALKFDVIFIDGLHTYEQSLRDFKNSLAFSHEKTIWIIDDTVPGNPYTGFADRAITNTFLEKIGYTDRPWHGDVYKTVLHIHDHYPEFYYCTVLESAQTVLWKTGAKRTAEPVFSQEKDLADLDYFGMLRHAAHFNPIPEHLLLHTVGNAFAPQYPPNIWEQFIYPFPAKNFKQ